MAKYSSSYEFIKDHNIQLVQLALLWIQLDKCSLSIYKDKNEEEFTKEEKKEMAEIYGWQQGILRTVSSISDEHDLYGKYITPLRNLMQEEQKILSIDWSQSKT